MLIFMVFLLQLRQNPRGYVTYSSQFLNDYDMLEDEKEKQKHQKQYVYLEEEGNLFFLP